MNKLSEKQKRFCEEYVKDMNGTQAAIRAGYSEKTARSIANENLTKPDIQTYIQELQTNIQKRNAISVDEIVQDLIEVKNRCMQKVPVTKFDKSTKLNIQVADELGRDVWQFDAQGALKALDLLMKHLGGYKEDNKQQQSITNNNISGFASLEDAAKHFKEMIGE